MVPAGAGMSRLHASAQAACMCTDGKGRLDPTINMHNTFSNIMAALGMTVQGD